MLFWNVLCSFVTHINELAVIVRKQTICEKLMKNLYTD